MLIYVYNNLGKGVPKTGFSASDGHYLRAITHLRLKAAVRMAELLESHPAIAAGLTTEEAQPLLAAADVLRWLGSASRGDPATLRDRLHDDNPLLRWLAVQVIAMRKVPMAEEMIDRLQDPVPSIRQAARAALIRLSRGTDFGPLPRAGKAERTRAVEQWKTWLALQRSAASAPAPSRGTMERHRDD